MEIVILLILPYRNPVVGINYLIKNQFIKPHPSHIAKFLLTKNGISRSAVGDYIGLLNDPLALQVTKYCFLFCLFPVLKSQQLGNSVDIFCGG